MNFYSVTSDHPVPEDHSPGGRSQPTILAELIDVLRGHPKGLRRWSVMRSMRDSRKRQSRDIPAKFEADIERIFRRYCADDKNFRVCGADEAPFYRPAETAGEVWALRPSCPDFTAAD